MNFFVLSIEILLSLLVGIVAVILVTAIITDRVIRAKGYRGPVSDHFDGTVFKNIRKDTSGNDGRKRSLTRVLSWLLTRKKNIWMHRPVTQTKPAERVLGQELVVTLINHATVLIQTNGLNIITDPIYAKRASPFSFVGPQRYANPGVGFSDLPPIDVILISHNHYDHMDLVTLKKLAERDDPEVIVPLANKELLARHGITNVTELDWWESAELTPGFTVVCVPAQHFSARAISDRNKTLWSGYVIRPAVNRDIYFAGDTGLGPYVDQIAERFPSGFQLGLLPIGAFKPERFMHEVHISPDEAFAIQERLNIKDVVAIHFGTFNLADDRQDEPKERVTALLRERPITGSFTILPNGGSVAF